MPFSRPTLNQLLALVAADVASAKPGADALLRFGNLQTISKMLAGLAYLHYGYEDWIAKQCVPFTATDEFLEGWAALKNVFRKPATVWTGTTLFTGCTPLTLIFSGTPVVRGDGKTYTSTATATVDGGGNATVPIRADETGAASNNDIGIILTLGVAITGIQSNSAVASVTAEGVNLESDDSLRARMLEAYREPAMGGAVADYIIWATQIPAVTRAWCKPNGFGAGTVIVYFMMDEAESLHGGFPQGTNGVAAAETRDTAATGDQLIVANYIYPLQPVTALVYSYAPANNAVAFTINNSAGWSIDTKNAVEAAMADVFFRLGSVGGVYMPDGSTAGEIDLNEFEVAISSVPGTGGFVIAIPSGNITSADGFLPTLGVVTFA